MGWPFDDEDSWNINTNAVTSPQQAQQGYINAYGNLSGLQQKDFMGSPIDKRLSFQTDANSQYLKGLNGNKSSGIGWNTGTLEGVGSIMGGLGSLAGAWAGLQNVKLGKQELASQKEQWNKNYASQATTVNNQIANQNAWKAAQGRSDMGNLVKTYLG